MFNKLFKSNKKRSTCIVLYTFDYNREKTAELFAFSKHYLISSLNVEFTYASFFNESYDVNYGKVGSIENKLRSEKIGNLVNFSLHTSDLKTELSQFNIEFNFSRPIQLTLQIPEDIEFDMLAFINDVSRFFYPQYGLVYFPIFDKWSTAYANGDQQHVKSEQGFVSFEKENLKRWFHECEKIRDGYVRDIFEVNIITNKHLDFIVQSKKLNQVIADNSLGDLELIVDGVYFWTLNSEQLDKSRELLYNSDILI